MRYRIQRQRREWPAAWEDIDGSATPDEHEALCALNALAPFNRQSVYRLIDTIDENAPYRPFHPGQWPGNPVYRVLAYCKPQITLH